MANNKPMQDTLKGVPANTNKERPLGMVQQQKATQQKADANQWTIAFVDNKNVQSGTKYTDYGYQLAHCDDAKDGEFVLVNRLGQVKLMEQGALSDDMRASINDWKTQYASARSTFESYRAMQEHAKLGQGVATYNADDPHQVNSGLDLLTNVAHNTMDNVSNLFKIARGQIDENTKLSWKNTTDSVKELFMRSTVGKKITNAQIEKKYGADWKEKFSGSAENIDDFLALDIDDDVKNYMAYQIVTGDSADGFGNMLEGTLINLGETLDYAANAVKATAMWANDHKLESHDVRYTQMQSDAETAMNLANAQPENTFAHKLANLSKPITDLDTQHDFSDKGLDEMLGEAFAPTYSDSGRATYNYNTGNIVADLVYEVISDPGTWVSFGASGVAKTAARTAVDASDDVAETSFKALHAMIKRGIQNGDDLDTVLARFAARTNLPDEAVRVIKEAWQYGGDVKLYNSLKTVNKIVEAGDHAAGVLFKMTSPLGAGSVIWKGLKTAVGKANLAKAIQDAYTDITAKLPNKELTPFVMQDYVDKANYNILGLNMREAQQEVLPMLSKDTRTKVFADTNAKYIRQLEDILHQSTSFSSGVRSINAKLAEDSQGAVNNITEYIAHIEKLAQMNQIADASLTASFNKLRIDYRNQAYQDTTKVIESLQRNATALQNLVADPANASMVEAINRRSAQLRETIIKTLQALGTDTTVLETTDDLGIFLATTRSKLANYQKAALTTADGTRNLTPSVSVAATTQRILEENKNTLTEQAKQLNPQATVASYKNLSDVKGRIYNLQLSKRADGDLIASDGTLLNAYTQILNQDTIAGREVYSMALDINESKAVQQMAEDFINDAHNTNRYLNTINAIDSTASIPEQIKEGLYDSLYTLDNTFNNSFKGLELSDINNADLVDRSRTLARSMSDHAMKFTSTTFEAYANTFKELNCCTANTAENVRAIKAQLDLLNYADPTRTYVVYSPKFVGNNLAEISFLSPSGNVTTLKNDIAGNFKSQQAFYQKFNQTLDLFKADARKQGKPIQLVGFNNHATGYDTDFKLSKQFRIFSTRTQLYDTLDVADLLRVQRGMPVFSDKAIEDLTDIITKELSDWYTDSYMLQNKLSLSFIPTAHKTALLNLEAYDGTYAHAAQLLDQAGARIKVTLHDISSVNDKLKELGSLVDTDARNTMPALRTLDVNKEHTILTYHKMYDDKVVRRYIDIDKADGEKASEIYEFVKDVQEAENAIAYYYPIYAISDEMWNDALAEYTKLLQLDKQGIVLRTDLNKAEKYALVQTLYTQANKAGLKPEFKLSSDFTKAITGSGVSYANTLSNITGSAVDPNSYINRAESILKGVNQAEEQFAKSMSYIEAHEYALRNAGLADSAELIKLQQQKELTDNFRSFINAVKQQIADVNFSLTLQGKYLEHKDGMTHVNQVFKNMSTIRDRQRLNLLTKLDDTQFLGHLIKDCNGRIVIDTQAGYNPQVINDILARAQKLDRVATDTDGRFVKIWFDCTGLSDKAYDEILTNFRDFQLPKMEIKLRNTTKDFDAYAVNNMLNELYKYSPNSMSYGMLDINSAQRVAYMDGKFFSPDAKLLPMSVCNRLGNFSGKYNCMYHGNINVLSEDGSNFLSNNLFTNLCSSYGKVVQTMNTTDDMLRFCFSEERNFRSFVENLNSIDKVSGRRNIAKAITDNGYVVCTLGYDNGQYIIRQLDTSTSSGFRAAMHGKQVTVLRYDTMRALQEVATYQSVPKQNNSLAHKAFEFYEHEIRPMFIKSYLSQKPMTWVRNAIDSPLKATFKEGMEHFSYLSDAVQVKNLYDSIIDDITTAYHKVDPETIARYFKEDRGITKDMFMDLRTYFANPISGTQAEDALRIFGDDPTSILKGYLNLGLTDKDLQDVVNAFKVMDAIDAPIYTKESMLYKQFAELYDTSVASGLTNMFSKYANMTKAQKSGMTLLDKIPPLKKWFDFNAEKFSAIETYNRLAILLKHMDEGDNLGQALKAIGETQFDYSKSEFMRRVEAVAPFSTFKFYNLDYWFDTVWNYSNLALVGDGAAVMTHQFDQVDENYWSDENMDYRAVLNEYIDTLDNEEDKSYFKEFKTWDDYVEYLRGYTGTRGTQALTMGWIKINDKIYFKSGLSMIDAFSMLDIINDPSATVTDQLFAPLQSLITLGQDAATTDGDVEQYVLEHQYELASLLPVVGSLYYSFYGSARNLLSGQDLLTVLQPSGFAPVRTQDGYTGRLGKWVDKPVGVDWYSQNEAYKASHRYILGVSYVPAFVGKDPATYVNTWGRMQQLGLSSEQIQELFDRGGNFWFTQNADGAYQIHNYQLMVGNEEAWNTIHQTLLSYGWTDKQATDLMNEAAIPMWKDKQKYTDARGYHSYKGMGYSKARLAGKATATRGKKLKTNGTFKYSGNYKAAKIAKRDRMPILKASWNSGTYFPSGNATTTRNVTYTTYRWHKRLNNIYKNNYAKYGASRMAMRQNLKNYSNRSVTELHRTEGEQRYLKIRLRRSNW